jgi:eukaryotic-like serine/threonine-protein kinase
MGVVYKAEDVHLGRFAALKFLPDEYAQDPQTRSRFEREACAASAMNHPNICTIYEIGEEDGRVFIAMEYLEGTSLRDLVANGPLALDQLVNVAIDVAEGLEAAHSKGVIHRDIKPANTFVISSGRAKILDFGLAKVVPMRAAAGAGHDATTEGGLTDETASTGGKILGTIRYMSPEQVRGKALDERSDLFSFGVTLYEAATGSTPFPGDFTPALLVSIVNDRPVSPRTLNPAVPEELARIIGKCLEKSPAERYQHASEIGGDLKRLKRDSESGNLRPRVLRGWGSDAISRKGWKIAGAIGLAAGVLGAGIFYFRPHSGKVLKEKDTIVIADFANQTGDTVFDAALRQGLAVQLEQSPFLSLVSEQQIQETLRLMGQPPDAKLTPRVAQELCQRTGSAGLLDGSIAQIGSRYLLTLKALNCTNGESLASAEAQASDKNHVLDALGRVASEIRVKLGESLKTVKKLDTPLERATTPSLEALHAYSLGWELAIGKNDMAAAIPLFQRAVRLDPNFAMAYASLANIDYNLGEKSEAADNTRKAYDLRDRVSEREKFYIEAHYHDRVTGDMENARRSYELWANTYPRDWLARNNLGVTYVNLGQYDKAYTEFQEGLRLNPGGLLSYANAVNSYLFLNRLEEGHAKAEEALAKNLDSPYLHVMIYLIAFLRNDVAEMARQLEGSAGKQGVEDVLRAYEADTQAYFGRLGKAREFSRLAVASAEQAGGKETAASYRAQAALREALFGNAAEAHRRAESALSLSTGRDVQYGAALALGMAGAAEGQVEKLTSDLAKRFPTDTLVQYNYLPTVHAQLALNRNDPSKAIEVLQAASPYELGTTAVHFNFLALYPVYVRGQAYLAAHQGGGAAAEFQKILDHPGVVVNEPIVPLARLGLARAALSQGDTSKARKAYADFLALWKDADSDIPALDRAKAEYRHLR